MSTFHESVLLQEVLDYLQVTPGGKYLDATLGGGGHTRAIIETGGQVLGLDQDPEAVQEVEKQGLAGLQIATGNFEHLAEIARKHGFTEIDGVLFDLGVSSHQLEEKGRGF